MAEKKTEGAKSLFPVDPFGHFMKSMNGFFQEKPVKNFMQSMDDLFSSPGFFQGFPVELNENEEEYIVQAKLSGVKKNQIELDALPYGITITVRHDESLTKKDDANQIISQKRAMQRSARTVPFPGPVDEKKINASYEDGLLIVTVPKIKGKKIDIP